MRTFASIYLFLSLLLADSCRDNQAPDDAFPAGTSWELDYISGPRIAFEGLFPDIKPQLTFEPAKGMVSGNSGCNGYSAPFELNGKAISLGEPGPSTMMYCGQGEAVFRKTLQQVDAWMVDADGKLNLMIGDVPMLRFKPAAQ